MASDKLGCMDTEFKKWISSCGLTPAVVEACSAIYETVTPDFNKLNHYTRLDRHEQYDVPEFKRVYGDFNQLGSPDAAIEYLEEHPEKVKTIANVALRGLKEKDDKSYETAQYEWLDETEIDFLNTLKSDSMNPTIRDIIHLVELVPETVSRFLSLDVEWSHNDREVLSDATRVINEWLVHNSSSAKKIWAEGFKYGSDLGSIAYSGLARNDGPYAYAFRLENAPLSTDEDWLLPYCSSSNGGSIVFIGSGIEVYHRDDEEHQVVFDRRMPKGCFLVALHDQDKWGVYGKDLSRPLVQFKDYDDCLWWIKKHGYDYRSSMKIWSRPVTESVSELREQLNRQAIASHEMRDHLWDQEPYADEEEIAKITDDEFARVLGDKVYEENLSEKDQIDLLGEWMSHLYDERLLGWDYTWNN